MLVGARGCDCCLSIVLLAQSSPYFKPQSICVTQEATYPHDGFEDYHGLISCLETALVFR